MYTVCAQNVPYLNWKLFWFCVLYGDKLCQKHLLEIHIILLGSRFWSPLKNYQVQHFALRMLPPHATPVYPVYPFVYRLQVEGFCKSWNKSYYGHFDMIYTKPVGRFTPQLTWLPVTREYAANNYGFCTGNVPKHTFFFSEKGLGRFGVIQMT